MNPRASRAICHSPARLPTRTRLGAVRVAPPVPLEPAPSFPHIRMDAMLQFLLGEALA